MKSDVFVSVGQAARMVGVTAGTIRSWANTGRLPVTRVGPRKDRRVRVSDLETLCGVPAPVPPVRAPSVRRVGLYVRVSGSSGQETSLAAQENELRSVVQTQYSDNVSVTVYRDKRSGLAASRPGLNRLLVAAKAGLLDVVYVTHEDRLARFGVVWLQDLLAAYGVELVVLHRVPAVSGSDELVADFVSLVACFSGRIYGCRSAAARKRLLAAAGDVS